MPSITEFSLNYNRVSVLFLVLVVFAGVYAYLDYPKQEDPSITIREAVGYLDFINLLSRARLVLTDSGGVQQEACIHHVPCVTLRENTEWRQTLKIGANRLAGTEPARIVSACEAQLRIDREWPVPFGEGDAAGKIADVAERVLRGP